MNCLSDRITSIYIILHDNGINSMLSNTQVIVTTDDSFIGNSSRFTINLTKLPAEAKPGDSIFINDGLVKMRVDRTISETEIECTVTTGGAVRTACARYMYCNVYCYCYAHAIAMLL